VKVLILDGYNLMHRARSGFTKGEWPVVFNFFRGLRPLVEKFDPDRVYFVLEGSPTRNEELLPSYKGSREVDPEKDPEKHAKLVNFHRQKDRIIAIVQFFFPVRTILHFEREADDVMAELARSRHREDEVTIVSGDSDMIQVLQECDNVQLYHPIRKKFVEAPDYDYVTWKALRGDPTDDIPGLPKVGDKTAEKLVRDPSLMEARFVKRPEDRKNFHRNLELIRLQPLDMSDCYEHVTEGSWDRVQHEFDQMGFKSILKEKTWKKYVGTFEGVIK